MALPLPRTEVHLWYVALDRVRDRQLLASYEGLLSPPELEKHQRLRVDKVRHEHLVTRATVRTVLSKYADRPPQAWVFEANEYGRPHIVDPPFQLLFNLSHTAGLLAVMVASAREVGVDVEYVDRRMTDLEDIARTHFAPSEVRELMALPASRRRARFFDYWTLKESYIKARGMGLSLPLEQFAFRLDGPTVQIDIDPRLADASSSWQFQQQQPTATHKAAVAVRRIAEPDLDVVTRWCVPNVDGPPHFA